jgi:hypothetical protein
MIPAVALGALLLGGPGEPAAVAGREIALAAVSLGIDACPAVARDELARLLALELEAPVLLPEQAGDRAVRVQVACTGATVRIAVDDPAKGSQLRRATVFPPEHEDVVVRLVALAISELVLTSRGALAVDEMPEARVERAPPAPLSPPPPAPDSGPPAGRIYVLALGQALGPFSGVGTGWGGGLRVGWAFGRQWLQRPSISAGPVADVELTAAGTSVDRALGTVQIFLWSATLRASLRLRAGRTWLDVGVGGRFGLAQLQGEPTDAMVARGGGAAGTWAGPVAYAGLGARVGHVLLATGIEGGRVLRTVSGTVDDGAPISIDGNWACVTVAAGWGE